MPGQTTDPPSMAPDAAAMLAPPPDLNPGACCPSCGGRRCPTQYMQYSGRRTIRIRRCRSCQTRYREVAIAVPID